jgi:hypothetical protein
METHECLLELDTREETYDDGAEGSDVEELLGLFGL